MSNVNSRSYHGQKKRKVIGSQELAASAGATTITVDASQGDIFRLVTAVDGTGSTPTFNIINAHDGQEVWISYAANDANDGTSIPVQHEASAVSGSPFTANVTSDNVNLIIVRVFDSNNASGVDAAAGTIIV